MNTDNALTSQSKQPEKMTDEFVAKSTLESLISKANAVDLGKFDGLIKDLELCIESGQKFSFNTKDKLKDDFLQFILNSLEKNQIEFWKFIEIEVVSMDLFKQMWAYFFNFRSAINGVIIEDFLNIPAKTPCEKVISWLASIIPTDEKFTINSAHDGKDEILMHFLVNVLSTSNEIWRNAEFKSLSINSMEYFNNIKHSNGEIRRPFMGFAAGTPLSTIFSWASKVVGDECDRDFYIHCQDNDDSQTKMLDNMFSAFTTKHSVWQYAIIKSLTLNQIQYLESKLDEINVDDNGYLTGDFLSFTQDKGRNHMLQVINWLKTMNNNYDDKAAILKRTPIPFKVWFFKQFDYI